MDLGAIFDGFREIFLMVVGTTFYGFRSYVLWYWERFLFDCHGGKLWDMCNAGKLWEWWGMVVNSWKLWGMVGQLREIVGNGRT